MKSRFFILLFIFCFLLLPAVSVLAANNLSTNLRGRILLQVQQRGEAWYVNPVDGKKYYLGQPSDTFQVMKNLSLGISNKDFNKLSSNKNQLKKLSGRILLKVEDHGRAAYINPVNLKIYQLNSPTEAFNLLRSLGLGITDANLNKIASGKSLSVKQNNPSVLPKNSNSVPPIVIPDQINFCNGQIYDNATQNCIDNVVVLKVAPSIPEVSESVANIPNATTSDLKYAVIYVYESADTYNPNWTDAKKSFDKVSAKLESLSGGKTKVDFDFLGEKKINDFCWNPATLLSYELPSGKKVYSSVPGSTFETNVLELSAGIKNINTSCPHCKIIENDESVSVQNTCENKIPNFAYSDGGFSAMKQRLLKELSNNPEQYTDTIIIFGRFGPPLFDEHYDEYLCNGFHATTLGWSNFALSEYAVNTPNQIVDCNKYKTLIPPAVSASYENSGWQLILHEILHHLGAVDVYQTGLSIGTKSDYQKALAVDSDVRQSIMGDIYEPCQDLLSSGIYCTQDQLDSVYLDKYNRQIMGW